MPWPALRPKTDSVLAPRPRSRLGLVAGFVSLALLAVACGDDGDGAATTTVPQGATATSAPATAAGPTKLRVAFVAATTTLPLHVAKQTGIFERNNLDVTLEQATNISDIIPTLGRQFDISLGTATDLIRAGAAGIDVVQIAGNTVSTKENPFVQVIVPADSGITDVAQLRGKTVGSPTLSGVIHVGVLWWAKQKGVDPSSIKGVEAPPPALPDQLKAGRLDAVEALEPFATTLKRDGFVSLGDPFSPIADPLATNFWVAQGSWARGNRDVVNRFTRSLEEARSFIQQNGPQARQILQGYTGMPAPVANSVPLPTYDFGIRTQDLATWIKVLRDIGQFDGNVEPSKLVIQPSR